LAPSRSLLTPRFVALVAAVALFAVMLFVPAVLNDGDTYMHIAAGRWMLDNQAVLRIDPFSYTFAGHPWQTHEWLSEVIMALAYVGGGWNGLVLLFAVAEAITAYCLTMYLSRRIDGAILAVTVVLAISCTAGGFLARPHMLAWPLLVVWSAEMVYAAEAGRRPPLWLIPLMVLWANLHASFVFGLALMLPMALEDALEHRSLRNALRHWGPFALVAVAASLLTPHGIDALLFPFKLMGMPQLYLIDEWRPLNLRLFGPAQLVFGFALFVFLSRGVRLKPVRLVVLLGLVYLALIHVRDILLLSALGPFLIARPLGESLHNVPLPSARLGLRTALAFALSFAVLGAARFLAPLERDDGKATPLTAFAHVPASLARQPVFNEYAFGGFLMFHDVRPFIDGRAELYGGKFIERYVTATRPGAATLDAILSKYRVRWTILAPDDGAVATMDAMKGWHRLYADKWAVIHVKDGAL
jgi:hypothetical protein